MTTVLAFVAVLRHVAIRQHASHGTRRWSLLADFAVMTMIMAMCMKMIRDRHTLDVATDGVTRRPTRLSRNKQHQQNQHKATHGRGCYTTGFQMGINFIWRTTAIRCRVKRASDLWGATAPAPYTAASGRLRPGSASLHGWRCFPDRRTEVSSSISRNTRVFAGISRRPGNTAQAVTAGQHHSGSTRTSAPLLTDGAAN